MSFIQAPIQYYLNFETEMSFLATFSFLLAPEVFKWQLPVPQVTKILSKFSVGVASIYGTRFGLCRHWVCRYHDDVMKWKQFPHYWRYVRGIYRSPVDSLQKGPLMRNFGITFDVSPHKLLNKQSRGKWIKSPWRRCNDPDKRCYITGRRGADYKVGHDVFALTWQKVGILTTIGFEW